MLQERWRLLGARVSVTAVDFPVFQERIGKGQFDSYIGAYLDQPSARGLADGWTRRGWGALPRVGSFQGARVPSNVSEPPGGVSAR